MLAGSQVLSENSEDYNAVFVGSSKTFRGINPEEFDGYVNRLSPEAIRSFNFGLGGATSGQIYGLSKNIIEEFNDEIKFLFVELRSVETSVRKKAFVKNLHTKRATIWVNDFKALKYSWRTLWGAEYLAFSFLEKIRFSFYFLVKYLDNRLNIGLVMDMIERRSADLNFEKELGQHGFVGLDKPTEAGLKKRRKKFLQNAEELVRVSAMHSKKTFGRNANSENPDKVNQPYVDELMDLIAYGAERDVRVIILALPLLKTSDYRNVQPVFEALPNDSKMDLCNYISNKELYRVEHCWDETHRNLKGAKLMSHRAGQRFLQAMGYKKHPVPYWAEEKKKAKNKKKTTAPNAL